MNKKVKHISMIMLALLAIISCKKENTPIQQPAANAVADSLKTGFPVIFIETKDQLPITSKETYLTANFKLIDLTNSEFNLETTTEIKGRGNDSWGQPKKPYRLKFSEKLSLFGLEKAKNWVLLANYRDNTLLLNNIAFELGHRLGIPFTHHYVYTEVVLNGEYIGNYVLTEHNEVNKGRVDIDEEAGWMVELDVNYDEDPKFETNILHLPVMIKSPEDLSVSGYDFVKNDINELEALLFAQNFPNNNWKDKIDINSIINYLIVNEITGNYDVGFPKSAYMYKDKDKKICMGPLWDFDWGFAYNSNTMLHFNDHRRLLFKPITYPNNLWAGEKFFCRFFADPEFIAAYKARWNEVYTTIQAMIIFINEQSGYLQKSQELNFKKWDFFGETYNGNINNLINYWLKKANYLNTEINNF
jgi:hypothetical protein